MKIKTLLIVGILCLSGVLSAQANGSLNSIGDKNVLQVWGNHYQRGYAQGFYLAPQIVEVFNDFYWTMFCFSSLSFYNTLLSYYQERFVNDDRMLAEVQGMAEGMLASGQSIFHSGLGRNIAAGDILLLNAVWDMVDVRSARYGKDDLKLGCASLSSWGAATAADSLLAGSGVITRWLDISQNSALIGNPLLIVHHPSESDEQKWINISPPGFFGSLTGISATGSYASLNTGNDNYAPNPYNLSPIIFDLRRGLERRDFDASGAENPLDILSAISAGHHLSATIIHILGESDGNVYSSVIETNNSATQNRLYNQNGNLPSHHLAATNHFRLLSSPVCCNRYANIQDSLYSNPAMTAKRQWQVLAGAAGLETTLTAVQFTPSTGSLLWACASASEPAYMRPALSLNTAELFSYSVANSDEYLPSVLQKLSVYPNPLSRDKALKLSSSEVIGSIELFNIKGQRVLSWNMAAPAKELSLPADWRNLARGIYLVRGKTVKGEVLNAKLVLH